MRSMWVSQTRSLYVDSLACSGDRSVTSVTSVLRHTGTRTTTNPRTRSVYFNARFETGQPDRTSSPLSVLYTNAVTFPPLANCSLHSNEGEVVIAVCSQKFPHGARG